MLSSKSLRKYMASVSEVALLTTGSETEQGKCRRAEENVNSSLTKQRLERSRSHRFLRHFPFFFLS